MPRIDGFEYPEELWYQREEHLWVRPDEAGGALSVTVGIDAGGYDALGEVVYLALEKPGVEVTRGDTIGTIEAEKMVRPIVSPVSGTLSEVNGAAAAEPTALRRDPYESGWLFRVSASRWEAERAELLHDRDAVETWIRGEIEAQAAEQQANG